MGRAAGLLRRVVRLRALPVVVAAWRAGRLSSAQVGYVNERTEGVFAEHQEAMVAALAPLTAREAGLAMRRWAASVGVGGRRGAAGGFGAGAVFVGSGFDGGGEVSGRLDGAGFQIVEAAVAAAMTEDQPDEPARTVAQRRADGLVVLARFFLDHADAPSVGRRRRAHVSVTVTLEALERRAEACTADGWPVSAATVEALLCDAGVQRFVADGSSVVVDVGRTTRTVSRRLFDAVALRDGGCRFPGCDRPVSWCEAHHVVAWQDGGSTEHANLVLLCWRHHHDFAHHPQWQLTLLADGTVEVTTPGGGVLTSRPPPVGWGARGALNLFAAVS